MDSLFEDASVSADMLHGTGMKPRKPDYEMDIENTEEMEQLRPGSKKLPVTRIVAISMFGDSDSAHGQLILSYEWHSAWIYRISHTRVILRNYHSPSFLIHSPPLSRGASSNEPGVVSDAIYSDPWIQTRIVMKKPPKNWRGCY